MVRQVASLFGILKSAADRVLDGLASLLAISLARRLRQGVVLIVDGALAATRGRTIAASGKNHR